MIDRKGHVREIRDALRAYPVVGILGPRQVGKTTLALLVAEAAGGRVHRFDLEHQRDRRRLEEALDTLEPLRGLIVLDEVHHCPELFPTLRVLADRRPLPARFLVLGSASPALLRQTSESLAGRVHYHELGGFDLEEVPAMDRLWLRGGFPPSYLRRRDDGSLAWRRGLVRTYLERDLPSFGIPTPSETIRRFWAMLAHVHGQVWNSSEMARNFGVSDKTVRGYLDVLASTFLVRLLRPWHENLAKRQVKSPKVYFRDSGLLHALLGIPSLKALLDHPRVGASWEGFALEQTLRLLRADPDDCHFWATHQGAELDLLVGQGRDRVGFEFKRMKSPGITPSMRIAMADLGLRKLLVVHPGEQRYRLGKAAEAVPLARLAEVL